MHLSQLLVPKSRHGEEMSINNLPMYSKQFGSNVKRYTSFSSVVFLTRQPLNELCLHIWPVVLNCTCCYHGNPGCCLIIFRITSLLTKHKKVIGNLRQPPFIFETQCLVSSTFPGQKNNAEPQIKRMEQTRWLLDYTKVQQLVLILKISLGCHFCWFVSSRSSQCCCSIQTHSMMVCKRWRRWFLWIDVQVCFDVVLQQKVYTTSVFTFGLLRHPHSQHRLVFCISSNVMAVLNKMEPNW